MAQRYLLAAVVAVGSAVAQQAVTGNTGAENATTPYALDGNRTIHYVTVGKATNNFYPNSINANVGDIVSFQFYPTNHSVIKSAYGYPCLPYEDLGLPGNGFTSGYMPVATIEDNPPTWNLTINDTQPVFYYCGAPGSCIDYGMVGVINANASTSISTQIALARQADFQLVPGEPFPSEAEQASMSNLAHSATTATLVVTESPTSSPTTSASPSATPAAKSSGLSTGAIAGIAVGAAAVGLGAAALFFLMGRTRSLKQMLDHQQKKDEAQRGDPMMQSQGPFSPGLGGFADGRHNSQLPPYQYFDQTHGRSDMHKPFDSLNRQGSPRSPYEGHFAPGVYQHGDPRYTMHSELSGNAPPVVELAAPHSDEAETASRFST